MDYKKEYEKLNKEYKKLLLLNEKNLLLIDRMNEQLANILINNKNIENSVLDWTFAIKECAENIDKFKKEL